MTSTTNIIYLPGGTGITCIHTKGGQTLKHLYNRICTVKITKTNTWVHFKLIQETKTSFSGVRLQQDQYDTTKFYLTDEKNKWHGLMNDGPFIKGRLLYVFELPTTIQKQKSDVLTTDAAPELTWLKSKINDLFQQYITNKRYLTDNEWLMTECIDLQQQLIARNPRTPKTRKFHFEKASWPTELATQIMILSKDTGTKLKLPSTNVGFKKTQKSVSEFSKFIDTQQQLNNKLRMEQLAKQIVIIINKSIVKHAFLKLRLYKLHSNKLMTPFATDLTESLNMEETHNGLQQNPPTYYYKFTTFIVLLIIVYAFWDEVLLS